jgi:hypothetical protein
MCESVVGSPDTASDAVLGTIPASVANYAAYFRMNFRDSSKPQLFPWPLPNESKS